VPVPSASSQKSPAEITPLLAVLCASFVAEHDPSWLARPVAALAASAAVRPDRISRLKARVKGAFASALAAASRRGRPKTVPPSEETRRATRAVALLPIATTLLALSRVPIRRRAVQEQLVCAYDRVHAAAGVTQKEFCAALALSQRTFRSWRARPPTPPPPVPPPAPPPPPKNDRATGRFDLEITAPGTQLGGDTTDLRVLDIDLKLVGIQDLGAREQKLFEAFKLDDKESAEIVVHVLTEALAGREGLQFLTDQGTPYLAQATKDACEAQGVEHAPQKEGAPTDKATVERAWRTVKAALAPLLDLTGRVATAIPALRRADLARALGKLLLVTFVRVYAAGRRHLAHPLAGHDPDALRAIIEEQRAAAHAEVRSRRLFLEAVHDEFAMPGSREAFVRAFKRYPLDDLKDAERRFRAYACRCQTRVCDRYFAAVVRDAHERGKARRALEWRAARARAEARRARQAAEQHATDLHAHPERRLHEGLTVLADTWRREEQPFLCDGALARIWLRLAVRDLFRRDPDAAPDAIEAHLRAWLALNPALPASLCAAVRGVLALVITDVCTNLSTPHSAAPVDGILGGTARTHLDNQRPHPVPDLRN
jgi:transposase InsO family protein